jgi:hypothetical protein
VSCVDNRRLKILISCPFIFGWFDNSIFACALQAVYGKIAVKNGKYDHGTGQKQYFWQLSRYVHACENVRKRAEGGWCVV